MCYVSAIKKNFYFIYPFQKVYFSPGTWHTFTFFRYSDAVQRNGMSGAGAPSGSAANAVKR